MSKEDVGVRPPDRKEQLFNLMVEVFGEKRTKEIFAPLDKADEMLAERKK